MGPSILRKSPLRVTAKLHNTSEDLQGMSYYHLNLYKNFDLFN